MDEYFQKYGRPGLHLARWVTDGPDASVNAKAPGWRIVKPRGLDGGCDLYRAVRLIGENMKFNDAVEVVSDEIWNQQQGDQSGPAAP